MSSHAAFIELSGKVPADDLIGINALNFDSFSSLYNSIANSL